MWTPENEGHLQNPHLVKIPKLYSVQADLENQDTLTLLLGPKEPVYYGQWCKWDHTAKKYKLPCSPGQFT